MSLANGHNQSKLPKTFLNFICKQTNKNLFYNNNNNNNNNNNKTIFQEATHLTHQSSIMLYFILSYTLTKDE